MILNTTITKKILETIIHETFSNFGSLYSSSLLDSLKLLGFSYATNAGISINIEDLKTPDVKKKFIDIANKEIEDVSFLWKNGKISDTERFQTIIDSWNVATESLKLRIVDYYQDFDPANNLYIMAFSGARGNMSQVRQLVGMRGLMSDQEGRIIDLPIQRNFREGLSSIDYVISSYGARKGIVDTALKTADSGYLTRRLIYLAQDLVIREIDCKTQKGVTILLKKHTDASNLIGNFLSSAKQIDFPYQEQTDSCQLLTSSLIKTLKQKTPLQLRMRSVLTCQSIGSLCQKCYGWDLSKRKIISLGETVGIIAAQSIGEPGTQLTMRTFHTGGIFTGETLKQIVAPFSGKVIFPPEMKTISFRTNHGIVVAKLQQEVTIKIQNWKGEEKNLFLFIGSYLYITKSGFVRAGDKIAEYSTQAFVLGNRRLKPFYSSFSGEIIKCENLHVRKRETKEERILRVNVQEGILWIGRGKVLPLPKEAKISFSTKLLKSSFIGKVKLITPFQGFIEFQENSLILWDEEKKRVFSFSLFSQSLQSYSFQFFPLVKNYQHVDQHTVLGYIYFYPQEEGEIYSIRKKEANFINTFFCVTDSDTWKVNSDQVNNYSFFQEKKDVLLPNLKKEEKTTIHTTGTFSRPGFFLKKDGFQMIFQDSSPIFLNPQTILNYKLGDFVIEKKVLGTLLNYTQQTEDIVQGLPKIEELIEARQTKDPCILAYRPGVLVSGDTGKKIMAVQTKKQLVECFCTKSWLGTKNRREDTLYLINSFLREKKLILYKNQFYELTPIPKDYVPYEIIDSKKKRKTVFVDEDELYDDLRLPRWDISREKRADLHFPDSLEIWENLKKGSLIYTNKYKEYIVQLEKEDLFVLLKPISPTSSYDIALNAKILVTKGNFIDIAEPLTDGTIDIHELLTILFRYHSVLDGTLQGTKRCLTKFQLLLVNSIQAIYQSQGVNISTKHIEIIVLQMTSKVTILTSGDSPFLPGELIRFSVMNQICETFEAEKVSFEKRNESKKRQKKILTDNRERFQPPLYEPSLLSATQASLSKEGFLSSAGFQETRRVLTKAAIEGKSDWLRGLKESIIVGRLIPAGTSFLNYKNYLDKIYTFQDSI